MAKKETTITTEEWLAELKKMELPTEPPEGYASVNTIATFCNRASSSVRDRISALEKKREIRFVLIRTENTGKSKVKCFCLEDLVKAGGI